MKADVIRGADGVARCGWAGEAGTALARYHDEVWGARTSEDSELFEALTLGVFQVGLSWQIVFNKREAFRRAFKNFEVAKVARITDDEIELLVTDASIIRNRAKIRATVDNAHVMISAAPALSDLVTQYTTDRKRAPRHLADLPTSTPAATSLTKQLKSQGYRYVGPTSVYAFLQNVGAVNDHLHGCFKASD
ncbi:DNA-3-methyladenine glycosylase I [Kribbella sp. NPDC055071]